MKQKIWLAVIMILALVCVCAFSAADGLVLKDAEGNTLEDGDYLEGLFYYKVYVTGLPAGSNTLRLGWNTDMSATAPWNDEWEERGLQNDNDGKGDYLMIIPDVFGDYDQEIMFAKATEGGPVTRIALYYDRDGYGTERPRVTTRNAPQLGQRDYTIEWTAVDGADWYMIEWQQPNGDCIYYQSGNTSINLQDTEMDPVPYAGNYDIQIIPILNDGHLGLANNYKGYYVNMPEADGRIWLSADEAEDGSNQIYMNYGESVNYHISAPGATAVRFMNGEGFDNSIQLDENGEADVFWMPERSDWRWGSRDYTAYAQAQFEGEEGWVTSNYYELYVKMNGDIEGEINWSITNEKAEGQETASVPRDSLVTIAVEPITNPNNQETEEVDFFCAYIADGDNWIADSHWVDANNEGTTYITMPVPNCPNGTYDVHVYAVRFGSPNRESEHIEQVTVTDAENDSPIIISMKDEYETGEPLRIRAWYNNPQNLENAWMHVTVCPADENDNPTDNEWYSEGKGFDFWENDYRIVYRGRYVLSAWIFQNAEGEDEPQEVEGTRTTFAFDVNADPDHDLSEPVVTINDVFGYSGNTISFTVSEVEHAEQYGYWVHSIDSNENLRNGGRDDAGTMSFDTDGMGAGLYQIEIDVTARGYQAAHSTQYFMLVEPSNSLYSYGNEYYTINPQKDGFNYATGENIRITYFVSSADRVKLYEKDENDQEILIAQSEAPGIITDVAWDEFGTHGIYGKYYDGEAWSDEYELFEIQIMGVLGEPNVDMPTVVSVEDDVKIIFNGNNHATKYSCRVEPDGEGNNTVYSKSWTRPGSKTILAEDEILMSNQVYRVYLDVDAEGYMNGHSERLLYVLGDDTDGIGIDVPNEINIGNTFQVTANAGDAEEIIVLWDADESNFNHRDGGWFEDTYCLDWELPNGTNAVNFTAIARVNGNELLVKRATATVTGTGSATQANAPTLTINENTRTVARNEYIEATINSDEEDAYEYHVNIFDLNDDLRWCGDYHWDEPGTHQIPTANLPEGQYVLGAWVRVHGKYSGDTGHTAQDTDHIVTITPCQNQFKVSKNTVQVCEPLEVSICAPGAERIRFSSGYDRWDNDEGWEGDNWYNDWVSWDFAADTVTMKAEALYYGNWQPIGSRRITITKEGDLEAPDLSGISDAVIPAGEDYTFTFDAVDHADRYEINAWRMSDGREDRMAAELNGEGGYSITIPDYFLDNENTGYMIQVTAFGTGYNAAQSEATFVTGQRDDNYQIELSADRNDAESNNDGIHFTVSAPGATLVRVYHEDQWFWAPVNEEGEAEIDVGFNREGLQPVWATACYDSIEDKSNEEIEQMAQDDSLFGGMSNIVNIRVYSRGETMLPSYIGIPGTVTWGDLLPVDISGDGNAEVIHIRIFDGENEIFFKEANKDGTAYLPTIMLTAEKQYQITIDGVCTGYTWSHDDRDYWFTVNAPGEEEDPERFMTSDRDYEGWVFVDAPYYVQMYAPGAYRMVAAADYDPVTGEFDDINAEWYGESGCSDQNGFWWETPGWHTLKGYAQYAEGGDWDEFDSVTLWVVGRELAIPEIQVDAVADNSGDITITIPIVENGVYYQINIHGENGLWGDSTYADDTNDDGFITADDDNVVFYVPANCLNDGSYWIDCQVNPKYPGMSGSYNSRAFMVNSGETDGNIEISVNKNPVQINEQFAVSVNAPGAKKIQICFGDQRETFDGESVRAYFSEGQTYTETLFAIAGYLDENADPYDWTEEDLDWRYSNGIVMEFCAEGQTGEPEFHAPNSVTQGEFLQIQIINEGDGANEVHANILRNNPNEGYEDWAYGSWQSWNERTREIILETSWLEPGRSYWLAVDNSGIGLMGNRRWHEFEVTEPAASEDNPEGIVFSAPDSVFIGEGLPVSIYAPDAWCLGFAVDGVKLHEDEYGNYSWGDGDRWSSANDVRWDNPEDEGEHVITAYAQYGDGEPWYTVNRTVTVINPNLQPPDIRVASAVNSNEDLTIAVPLVPYGMHYEVNIHPLNDDEPVYHGYKNTEDDEPETDPETGEMVYSFTVEGGLTEGTYWIDCLIGPDRTGMNHSESHKSILVRNSQTDNRITLGADATEVPVNTETGIHVSVDDEDARAVLITYGDHSMGSVLDENGEAYFTISEGQEAWETLYAQVCYDPNAQLPGEGDWNFNWGSLTWGNPSSETLEIHFICYGDAGEPSFDAPWSVVQGDVLKVTNIGLGEGANEAHANINVNGPGQEEVQIYGYGWHGWDANTRTIYMSTSMLEPGRTYWLMVDNSGPGRTTGRGWHEFTVRARSDEEMPDNGVIFTVPQKVQVGTVVPINVYAPDATKTGFGVDLTEEQMLDPESYHDEFGWISEGAISYNLTDYRWYEPGEHTINAYALFEGSDTPAIITQTVRICNPLRFDLSGLPAYFEYDQTDASVTIPMPANADVMCIQVYNQTWTDSDNWRIYENNDLTGNTEIEIPAEYLYDGNEIQIDYQAYAEGFEDYYGGTSIRIIPPAGEGAMLTVETGSTENLQTNQTVTFKVSPSEGRTIEEIQFYDGYGYRGYGVIDRWTEDNLSALYDCRYSFPELPERPMTVYAMVRLDGDTDWQRTNSLVFTVTAPNGPTSEYDFTSFEPITAVQGETVTVEFTECNATYYWADIFRDEDDHSFCPPTYGNGTTVRISTINIPAGTYIIRGRAEKTDEPGWLWSESTGSRTLIITDEIPVVPEAQFVTPASLNTIEEEAFAGIAARVVKIKGNVSWIDNRAFAGSQVETVIFENGWTQVDDHAFDGCGIITVYSEPGGFVQEWASRNLYTFYPITED